MSYDIRLIDPDTRETIQLPKHNIRGGTYALGGTTEAWLNITYNYGVHFERVLDEEEGIRVLYGKTVKETIPLLEKAVSLLRDDINDDYWEPTEGNARSALMGLLELARMSPENAIWDGD